MGATVDKLLVAPQTLDILLFVVYFAAQMAATTDFGLFKMAF